MDVSGTWIRSISRGRGNQSNLAVRQRITMENSNAIHVTNITNMQRTIGNEITRRAIQLVRWDEKQNGNCAAKEIEIR